LRELVELQNAILSEKEEMSSAFKDFSSQKLEMQKKLYSRNYFPLIKGHVFGLECSVFPDSENLQILFSYQ
jgi:hypothetical protein